MAELDILKIKGIVTRAVQYRENDKILTVLTAEMGLISVYCHGAKSNRSKALTSSRIFCYSEFVLVKKGDFYYIKEADYIEAFFDIVNSVDKLFLGQYFLEVANEVCVEGERADGMLRLCLNSLYALSEGLYDARFVKAVFEIRVCVETGLSPNVLSGCVSCGNTKCDSFYFDVLNGDMICRSCVIEKQTNTHNKISYFGQDGRGLDYSGYLVNISPSVVSAIAYVVSAKNERVFSFSLTDSSFEMFCTFAEKYLLNQLGKSFVTLDLYNEQIK